MHKPVPVILIVFVITLMTFMFYRYPLKTNESPEAIDLDLDSRIIEDGNEQQLLQLEL